MRKHVPVLFQEVIDAMPSGATAIFDGTLGHAGHTVGMAQSLVDGGTTDFLVVGADRDDKMILKARHTMEESGIDQKHFCIVQTSYADMTKISAESGVKKFDYILLDIGVNMDHFKEADRGFSLKLDGALDMRFDTTTGEPVSTWMKKARYQDYYDLFEKYADFPHKTNDTISKELVVWNKKHGFSTTKDLKEWAQHVGVNDKKLAIIFQTLRILVNKELEQLENFLQSFTEWLQPGGVCAIISYHSGEDRRVKYAFKELQEQDKGTIITKHVIKPHRKEVQRNKAARSAKMRLFEAK